jgi:hypothetical protein
MQKEQRMSLVFVDVAPGPADAEHYRYPQAEEEKIKKTVCHRTSASFETRCGTALSSHGIQIFLFKIPSNTTSNHNSSQRSMQIKPNLLGMQPLKKHRPSEEGAFRPKASRIQESACKGLYCLINELICSNTCASVRMLPWSSL